MQPIRPIPTRIVPITPATTHITNYKNIIDTLETEINNSVSYKKQLINLVKQHRNSMVPPKNILTALKYMTHISPGYVLKSERILSPKPIYSSSLAQLVKNMEKRANE